jgi:hypothetical protein
VAEILDYMQEKINLKGVLLKREMILLMECLVIKKMVYKFVFENLVTIIRTRHVGDMTQPYVWQGHGDDAHKTIGEVYSRGEIPYLLIESHSTSRKW